MTHTTPETERTMTGNDSPTVGNRIGRAANAGSQALILTVVIGLLSATCVATTELLNAVSPSEARAYTELLILGLALSVVVGLLVAGGVFLFHGSRRAATSGEDTP